VTRPVNTNGSARNRLGKWGDQRKKPLKRRRRAIPANASVQCSKTATLGVERGKGGRRLEYCSNHQNIYGESIKLCIKGREVRAFGVTGGEGGDKVNSWDMGGGAGNRSEKNE